MIRAFVAGEFVNVYINADAAACECGVCMCVKEGRTVSQKGKKGGAEERE